MLRRAGMVTSDRDGAPVRYALAGPDVADLMRAARRILTEMLAGQDDLLDALRETHAEPTRRAGRDRRRRDRVAGGAPPAARCRRPAPPCAAAPAATCSPG